MDSQATLFSAPCMHGVSADNSRKSIGVNWPIRSCTRQTSYSAIGSDNLVITMHCMILHGFQLYFSLCFHWLSVDTLASSRQLSLSYFFFPPIPDKLCDQVSDAMLDAHLAKDPNSKIACGEWFTCNDTMHIVCEEKKFCGVLWRAPSYCCNYSSCYNNICNAISCIILCTCPLIFNLAWVATITDSLIALNS